MFKNGKQFPEIFRNKKVRIYLNPSEEIFIEDIESGVTIRLNNYYHSEGGLLFTTSGIVEPIRLSNMIGWSVVPRR